MIVMIGNYVLIGGIFMAWDYVFNTDIIIIEIIRRLFVRIRVCFIKNAKD